MSIQSEITRINDEVTAQTSLIQQIGEVLATKIAGGGKIPDGWEAGYSEIIIDSETTDVLITFTGVSIDPDDCIFFCWTDIIASAATVQKRVSVGFAQLSELAHSQLFLQSVSSSGGYTSGSQLDTDEITITNSASNTTVTVGYVSTRRFKAGNTYKAIIFGKKVTV